MTKEELKAAAALVGGHVFGRRVIKLVIVDEPTCESCCLQYFNPFCQQKVEWTTSPLSCTDGYFVEVKL